MKTGSQHAVNICSQAGYLDWHSMECVTPKLWAISECWNGVALHLLECGVQVEVECFIALQGTVFQIEEGPSRWQHLHTTLLDSIHFSLQKQSELDWSVECDMD